MATRIRVSVRARADLRALYFDGAETFGVRQADLYAGQLEAAIERLSRFPSLGRALDERDPSVRILSHPPHLVLYRLNDAGVDISCASSTPARRRRGWRKRPP